MKLVGRGGMVVNENGVIHVVLTEDWVDWVFVSHEEELVGPRGSFECIYESCSISIVREIEYDHPAIQLMRNRWPHPLARNVQPHYQKCVYAGARGTNFVWVKLRWRLKIIAGEMESGDLEIVSRLGKMVED